MQIKSIELTEIQLPLVHFFETSFGRTYERRIILVRVEDTDGNKGWGEITCGESPGYSDEWTDAAWVTTEKILAPMVVGKEVESAADIWGLMKWARGHRMSKASIETACWDLEAKKLGVQRAIMPGTGKDWPLGLALDELSRLADLVGVMGGTLPRARKLAG